MRAVPPTSSPRRPSRAKAAKAPKASCASCFFATHDLCALVQGEPCSTFRPDSAEGLRPPQQMRFVFGQERRARAAWAFPSADEQAERYAAH